MIVHPDGQARLDGVGPVSQATAEMICCDAEVTEVTMTRNHEVLDAGRTRRQPTRRQRIAVIARDQVCIGCGGPVSRSQIHHVEWWTRDLGDTDEDNLCLVCWGAISTSTTMAGRWSAIRAADGSRCACRTRQTGRPAGPAGHDGDEPADPRPRPEPTGPGRAACQDLYLGCQRDCVRCLPQLTIKGDTTLDEQLAGPAHDEQIEIARRVDPA